MAFRASSAIPAKALDDAKAQAAALDSYAAGQAAIIQASGISADRLLGLWQRLAQIRATLGTLAQTPDLASYAQAQEGDATYDVSAEFTAMLATIDDATAWLSANVTKDIVLSSISATGTLVWAQFTAAQAAPLVTKLSSISASIS